MTRWLTATVVALTLAGVAPAWAGNPETLSGYAEWRRDGLIIVDGQRVRPGAAMKFKPHGDAKTWDTIPLGYELKVKGRRAPDGVVVAEEAEAKPNGEALFEGDLKRSFDQTEAQYRQAGRAFEQDGEGRIEDIGELYEEGPEVDRVREILDAVTPPYLNPQDFRIYVVHNKEWNAFAAPNGSIYVYSGLLRDLDDDEVAIVLGHELAHATHEHSRRGFKKQLLIMAGAVALDAAAEGIKDKNARVGTQVGVFLLSSFAASHYGRAEEDQADRVGMRYAYEAGYDVSKGPELWQKFAKKYGDENKVVNFFFGDHSRSSARATNLNLQIALNYRGQ